MSETKDYALKTMRPWQIGKRIIIVNAKDPAETDLKAVKYKHHSRYEEQANQAAYKADLAILRMMEG